MPHILIVDDEPNQRIVIEQALRIADPHYTIQTAASAEEALEQTNDQMPDLIITDYNMPLMSGLEFVAQLRDRGITVPVLLMTAYSAPEVYSTATALHVRHYLTKPVPISHLRRVVRSVLEQA